MLLIDSTRLTAETLELKGELPVASFARLTDSVVVEDTPIHYRILGGRDRLSRPTLRVLLRGSVRLICQRCMEPMPFDIDIDTTLTLFNTEDALLIAEEEDADIEGIVLEETLDVLWLIEEELILALPYIPVHDACAAVLHQEREDKADELQRPNPFAVLKSIKTRSES